MLWTSITYQAYNSDLHIYCLCVLNCIFLHILMYTFANVCIFLIAYNYILMAYLVLYINACVSSFTVYAPPGRMSAGGLQICESSAAAKHAFVPSLWDLMKNQLLSLQSDMSSLFIYSRPNVKFIQSDPHYGTDEACRDTKFLGEDSGFCRS